MKFSFLYFLLFSLFFYPETKANTTNGSLQGFVKDQSGTILPGATVLITELNKGTATDARGWYILEEVPEGNYNVSISFMGYQNLKKQVFLKGGTDNELNIVLNESTVIMGEVIVTTQKREQSSLEVPAAINALSGISLERLNVGDMDELSQFVPGLQMQLQSPNNPGFVIRGVTSDDGDSRVQPRVSVFQDGVSISRSRGAAVELFDMERVEVVKGPQGTLFGRGAQIGAVHLIQKKPLEILTGELSIGTGNYKQKLASGYINVPVTDALFNRLSFSYNERDGYIKNLSGGTLNGKKTIALRNTLRLKTKNSGTADLIFNFQRDGYPGTSFKSKAYAPAGGDTNPWSTADLEQGKELGIDRDVWGTTLLVNQKLSQNWDLSSISSFRYFYSDESFDADGTAAPSLWFSEIAEGKQLSQEFRFNFDNKKKISGFVGANYFWEDGSQRVPLRTNPQSLYTLFTPSIVSQINANTSLTDEQKEYLASLIYQPLLNDGIPVYVTELPLAFAYLEPALAGLPLSDYHEEEQSNYGSTHALEFFIDGSYKITPKLSITLGLRGTYEKQKGGYLCNPTSTPSPLGYLMGNYPNILFPVSDGKIIASKDYISYVGRFALSYRFKNNNLYGSISRGRRPGVIDIQPAETNYLKPEIVWSYEAGIKGGIAGGKVGYDLSAYYYDWNNFQTTVYDLATGGLGQAVDAGKAHSMGLETGLSYNIYNGTSLFANYGYIKGEFNNKDSDGNRQDYAGNTFRLTPKHSFSAGLDANTRISSRSSVYFRPNYTYKSKVYFEDTNDEALTQNAYGIINITTGITFNNSLRYQLGFFGKNMLDEKFIIDAGNTGNAFGIPTYIAGARRLIGIELKVTF